MLQDKSQDGVSCVCLREKWYVYRISAETVSDLTSRLP